MPELLTAARPVRVVIVDDTRSIRAMIRAMLARSPRIEVVGEAGDPYEAREMIRALNPDVITLDVVMPRMDGLSFLERLMRLRPMPVVMVSTRTTEKSREAITALALGAVDCVDLGLLNSGRSSIDLVETVLIAATSNPGNAALRMPRPERAVNTAKLRWNGRVVLIGSSTGGVDALLTVLGDFPADCPPTVIAQHMPAPFLESFARRLDRRSAATVALAEDGARLEPGRVYLAPGGTTHTVLHRRDAVRLALIPHDGAAAYVPSVDLLFASALPHAQRIVGVMLTGMGRDGADALLALRKAGAHTIVQDAASAVIDGMPRSARENGAAVEVATLTGIAARVLASVSDTRQASAT
jgi:two-component system chemotaxis response regulator CheB